MMSQPLPAKIFNQGGIPAVIPKLEIDNDPNGQTGSYQPGGQTVTSQNAFFNRWAAMDAPASPATSRPAG